MDIISYICTILVIYDYINSEFTTNHDEAHITPIPTDEDLSSLSAILMDDEYYNYTILHSQVIDGVHIADIDSLEQMEASQVEALIMESYQLIISKFPKAIRHKYIKDIVHQP